LAPEHPFKHGGIGRRDDYDDEIHLKVIVEAIKMAILSGRSGRFSLF